MTDQTVIEEDEAEEAKVVGEPMEETSERTQNAWEMVPVKNGIAPATLADAIEFARSMAKAKASLPDHLQGNVGDCLAVIDIAQRSGLSAYMLAAMTYVEPKSKRLSFMSQAYHAMAQPFLKGDFEVRYEGEGDERVCIVKARLKHDPHVWREHRSPPLKMVRPARNEHGTVKGSPLWTRKPDVQLFYDTSRDWVRIYAPRATLGIYTPEELDEAGIDNARDVTATVTETTISQRLSGPNGDGHKAGHVETELDNVAARSSTPVVKVAKKAKPKAARKPPKTAAIEESAPANDSVVDAPAHVSGPPAAPTTAAEYVAYAEAWIAKIGSAEDAWARWDGERDDRERLKVQVKASAALQKAIEARFA